MCICMLKKLELYKYFRTYLKVWLEQTIRRRLSWRCSQIFDIHTNSWYWLHFGNICMVGGYSLCCVIIIGGESMSMVMGHFVYSCHHHFKYKSISFVTFFLFFSVFVQNYLIFSNIIFTIPKLWSIFRLSYMPWTFLNGGP